VVFEGGTSGLGSERQGDNQPVDCIASGDDCRADLLRLRNTRGACCCCFFEFNSLKIVLNSAKFEPAKKRDNFQKITF